jgi:hypothetical protein
MGARQKLNAIYAYGFLAVAAIIGAGAGSWTVFLITTGLLLLLGMHAGNLRPNARARHTFHERPRG